MFAPEYGGSAGHERFRRLAVALLLASGAFPAQADSAVEETTAAAQPAPEDESPQDIFVTGQRLLGDITPESQLDEQAIESYGVSTVEDLLGEVEAELGEDEEPLILVNGERVTSLDEIGAYPVEVLRNLQVLPRGSAIRLGGTNGQRVITLTLQRTMRAATLTAAEKAATEGGWHAARGEALFTYLQGPTRANVGLRARDEGSLFESERNILQPAQGVPYSLEGNVVGFPNTSAEIDPLLSALAGEPVTVAPIPSTGTPALSDFAAAANQPNSTDRGRFRTLRPNNRIYNVNGTFSTRLAPWLTGNALVRLDRTTSRSLRGLPSGLFVLSPTNTASPFSNDVGIARFGHEPLHSLSRRSTGEGRITLNGRLRRWTSTLNASHFETRNVFDSDRQASFGAITLGDDVNPFATDLTPLINIRRERSSSKITSSQTQLSFTGPAANLPAGPLQTTIEGRLSWYSLKSHSTFSAVTDNRLRRNEQSIRGAIDVPLTSRSNNFLPQVGDIDATAEYGHVHYSDAGSLDRYALGLTWEPVQLLRLRASIERNDRPPAMEILGSPVIETPQVRIFDPLTGETVDVTQIGGGNPSLLPEKTKIRRLSALFRLVPRLDLQLNSEYTDTDSRNYISSLPPASVAVMVAFPDRYVRDASGTLRTVDLRPVNFDSHREKRLRWGVSMRTKLSSGNILGGPPIESVASDSDSSEDGESATPGPPQGRTPSTYLQLTANHTMVFSDRLTIRSGLDHVDLLGGGALGIGGGRVRHQLDGTAALTSGGLGARMGVVWRGASTLDTSIGGISDTLRFSPLLLVNLKLFADARRFLPESDWARGLRFSVNAVNLTNSRQKVRTSGGNTPLQYQPAYRDPLGRTIEFEIRKVF